RAVPLVVAAAGTQHPQWHRPVASRARWLVGCRRLGSGAGRRVVRRGHAAARYQGVTPVRRDRVLVADFGHLHRDGARVERRVRRGRQVPRVGAARVAAGQCGRHVPLADTSRTAAPTPRTTAHGLRRGRSATSALQRGIAGSAHRHRCAGGLPGGQHRRHGLRGAPTPHVDGVATETGAGTVTTRRTTTKQALFDATPRLARGRGLGDVTVDEIAAAAGVAKGTVDHNFGSKDGLVTALLRYGVDELAARLTVTSEASDPAETLDALVDNALR